MPMMEMDYMNNYGSPVMMEMMPMSYDYGVGSFGPPPTIAKSSKPPAIKVRNFMPETWIFENYLVESDKLEVATTVPDTITSWLVSSYCVGAVSSLRELFFSILKK